MSPFSYVGKPGPWVIMLHWLGGTARTWTEVSLGLAQLGARPIALDLPGFGVARDEDDFTIHAMMEKVITTVQRLRTGEEEIPWLIVGHSMGGKVAACVARAAADGRSGLQNLAGTVLISPSPPGPEPMEESKREELLRTLGRRTGTAQDSAHAEKFVDDNTGTVPLEPVVRARAVDDVLRSSASAFAAWLTTGSKEDLSPQVATIHVPTLILAGTEDSALGPDAQRRHTLPHFTAASMGVLQGCGHLAPIERPMEVVKLIANFLEHCGIGLHRQAASLGSRFAALIASDHTSPQTRALFASRLEGEPRTDQPILSPDERLTLEVLCARVVPGCSFDLSSRIESWLASAKHDGWRDDRLPPDQEAWRTGLRALDAFARRAHNAGFATLEGAQQDALLLQAREKTLDKASLAVPHSDFDAEQMHAWFEDVRGELTKIYMADPRTMEQVGFTGFADEQGFTQIRLGEFEEFEEFGR